MKQRRNTTEVAVAVAFFMLALTQNAMSQDVRCGAINGQNGFDYACVEAYASSREACQDEPTARSAADFARHLDWSDSWRDGREGRTWHMTAIGQGCIGPNSFDRDELEATRVVGGIKFKMYD